MATVPWILALMLALNATPTLAHKLKVFAAAEGSEITGSAYFAGGGKASGATILITNAAGEVLAALEPAADGSFSYQARAPVEHRVIAQTADGHRAEWRIRGEDLAGGFALASGAPRRSQAAPPSGSEDFGSTEAGTTSVAAQPIAPSTAALEVAVARQIRPLREELLATREDLRLRDILGGLGYIFGLTGLALWWRARRERG